MCVCVKSDDAARGAAYWHHRHRNCDDDDDDDGDDDDDDGDDEDEDGGGEVEPYACDGGARNEDDMDGATPPSYEMVMGFLEPAGSSKLPPEIQI